MDQTCSSYQGLCSHLLRACSVSIQHRNIVTTPFAHDWATNEDCFQLITAVGIEAHPLHSDPTAEGLHEEGFRTSNAKDIAKMYRTRYSNESFPGGSPHRIKRMLRKQTPTSGRTILQCVGLSQTSLHSHYETTRYHKRATGYTQMALFHECLASKGPCC